MLNDAVLDDMAGLGILVLWQNWESRQYCLHGGLSGDLGGVDTSASSGVLMTNACHFLL
jgi:hypothetical protein